MNTSIFGAKNTASKTRIVLSVLKEMGEHAPKKAVLHKAQTILNNLNILQVNRGSSKSPIGLNDYYHALIILRRGSRPYRSRNHQELTPEEMGRKMADDTMKAASRPSNAMCHQKEASSLQELKMAREFLRACGDDLKRAQTVLELVSLDS